MKKLILLLVLSLSVSVIFAQGSSEEKISNKDSGELSGYLNVATNGSDVTYAAVKSVIDSFVEENPNVEIDYTTYSKNYENLMKAKMAANDLPDVFATHGWSVKRYAEYLLPLQDLTFTNNLSKSILNVITTKAGDVVTLPLTVESTGIIYNKDILKEAGWNEPPKTWDEFYQVCEAVKQLGIIPVYNAGKDTRSQANLMDIMAPAALISYEKDDNSQSLYDGTFDWSKWDRVSGLLTNLKDRGYLNVDANTADTIYKTEKLLNGEIMFLFDSASQIAKVWDIDPSVNLGMMPVPTYYADDEPITIGGEREAYGIWKDSENIEIAKALLEYMAKPENIKRVCEAIDMPAGFTNVSVDLRLAEDYKAFQNLRTFPYFDREWLPSGMWATMRSIGGGLTSDEITVEESSQIMKEDYINLRSQL
jgi:raffinose/stachyose/melibiose transport system substrate-binding protein